MTQENSIAGDKNYEETLGAEYTPTNSDEYIEGLIENINTAIAEGEADSESLKQMLDILIFNRDEKKEILNVLNNKPLTVFFDQKGNKIDPSVLKDYIRNINREINIINKTIAKNGLEKPIEPTKVSNKKVRKVENISKNDKESEKKEKIFNFKIEDTLLKILIESLGAALKESNTENKDQVKFELKIAKRERVKLLKEIEQNPDVIFKKADGTLFDLNAIKIEINTIKKLSENRRWSGKNKVPVEKISNEDGREVTKENIPVQNKVEKEEENDKNEYISIQDSINNYSEELENNFSIETEKKIEDFILQNKNEINNLINKIKDKKDTTSISLLENIKKELDSLKQLYIKMEQSKNKKENGALSDYDNSLIELINDNTSFSKEYFIKNHDSLINKLIENIESKRDKISKKELDNVTRNHENTISHIINIILDSEKGISSDSELFRLLNADLEKISIYKSNYKETDYKEIKKPQEDKSEPATEQEQKQEPEPEAKTKDDSKKVDPTPEPKNKPESKPEDKEKIFPIRLFQNEYVGEMAFLGSNPDLANKIKNTYDEYNKKIREGASVEEKQEISDILDELKKEFEAEKNNNKSSAENPEPNKNEAEQNNEKKFPIRSFQNEYANEIALLSLNPDLANKILNTFARYNKKIDKKAPTEQIEKLSNELDELRREFEKVKNSAPKNPENKPKKAEAEKEPEKVNPEPEENTNPENNPTSEPQKPLTKEDMFTFEDGKNYDEITEDKNFDKWFNNIYKNIENSNLQKDNYVKSIDAWYARYQESIPYQKKLEEVFKDIELEDDSVKKQMSKEYMDKLLFSLYLEKSSYTKNKIESIYNSYKSEGINKLKIEKLQKQLEDAKKSISNVKGKEGDPHKYLKYDEVKKVMDSLGEPLIKENITELAEFLKDMSENYDFYNTDSAKEDDLDNNLKTFKRYESTRKAKDEESGTKKLGFWQKRKAWASTFFKLNSDRNRDEGAFSIMLHKMRELDLVNRKDKTHSKEANAIKMRTLIDTIEGNEELLTSYITNPKPEEVDVSGIDAEQLEVFKKIYKAFTESKYKTNKTLKKVEDLIKDGLPETVVPEFESKSSFEHLFGSEEAEDFEILKNEATLSVNKKYLEDIKNEIEELKNSHKTKKDLPKVETLSRKFDEVRKTIEELGGEYTNILELKTFDLKIQELILKNIDKDDYNILSKNTAAYDRILMSKDSQISKKDKVQYFTDLINALETHKANPKNTTLQSTVLGAMIKKYKEALKSI